MENINLVQQQYQLLDIVVGGKIRKFACQRVEANGQHKWLLAGEESAQLIANECPGGLYSFTHLWPHWKNSNSIAGIEMREIDGFLTVTNHPGGYKIVDGQVTR